MKRDKKSIIPISNAVSKIGNQIAIGEKLLNNKRDFYCVILKSNGELRLIERFDIFEKDVVYYFKIPFLYWNSIIVLTTAQGIYFSIRARKLIELLREKSNINIGNLIEYDNQDKIISVIVSNNINSDGTCIIFATEKGMAKRTLITEFKNECLSGKRAIRLYEDDKLIATELISDNVHTIMIATKYGKVIRFTPSKLKSLKRFAYGNRGITLIDNDDKVIGLISSRNGITSNQNSSEEYFLGITEKGYGKRTYIDDPEDGECIYRITNRGFKGVKTFNVTDETGYLTNIMCVKESGKNLILIGKNSNIRLRLNDVPVHGRATMGIKLIDQNIIRIFEE